MNTEKLNQEVLNEEVVEEIIDTTDSEDYQEILNDEQEAFEAGVDDDEPDVEMIEEHINEQTLAFLKLRGERKK